MNWKEQQNLHPQVIQAECEAAPEDVDYEPRRLDVLNRHLQKLIDVKIILSGS